LKPDTFDQIESASDDAKPQERRVDSAYNALKESIIGNKMPPGSIVMEKEIAADFGMSRTPVREAIIRLQDEGLVKVIPRRGVVISSISRDDMKEIYEILMSLETTAIELLAKRKLDQDSPEILQLEAAILRMQQSLEQDNLEDWAKADSEFHNLILRHCGNSRLNKMAQAVSDQANRVRVATLRLRPKPTESTQEHADTVEAIKRHDIDAARISHRQHRERHADMLLDLTDRYNLRHM